jgi:hypothetical protein
MGTMVNNLALDNHIHMSYIIPMMNDMIDIGCEEMISDADEARMEHERAERESERAETWAAIEAQYGPLHRHAYAAYEGMAWKD